MPRAEAREWWADVEDVRERIERRRARENRAYRESAGGAGGIRCDVPPAHRGVREIRPGRRLMLVETAAPSAEDVRRARSRSREARGIGRRVARGVGPRPDMIAAWAVALGFALVIVAILSTHR